MKTTKLFQTPLGVQSVGGLEPVQRGWIATAVGAGLSLATSLFGSSASRRAAERAEQQMHANKAENDALIRRQMNESYVDSAAGQNLIRRAKEYANENAQKAAGAKAVAGGTDAAEAIAKEQGNKMIADTMSNLAAQDTARKDAAVAKQIESNNQYAQQKMAIDQQKANATAQAAGAASNAIMAAGSLVDGGLTGGDNKGKPTEHAFDFG